MTTPAPTGDQTVEPIAPEVQAPPSTPAPVKVEFSPEQQAALNAIVEQRLERARTAWEKAAPAAAAEPSAELTERIAQLEASAAASETAAVSAIVAQAAASAHDPNVVARLVDLSGLTSADPDAIRGKVGELLAANPYLVRTDGAPAPVLTPAPGVSAEPAGERLYTQAEMDRLTAHDLADPAVMARYIASRTELAKRA